MSLCFPDGYSSNISILMSLEEDKLYGMKIHDCHMLMQTLIPLTYMNLLPKQ